MRRIVPLLAFALVALAASTAAGAYQLIYLWYCFLPDEPPAAGELNDNRELVGVPGGDTNVGDDSYPASRTVYAIPPAGTKIDYWLVSKDQLAVFNDISTVRTAYGKGSYTWTYDGSGDNVYVGARFAYISYGISFSGNGSADGDMSSLYGIVYTNSFALSANAFSKTGYSFAGWRDAAGRGFADGQLVSGADFGVVDDGTNVVLSAQWVPSTYTVTFDANGGSVSTASKNVTYGSTYGDLPVPTCAGHDFTGWYTDADGGTEVTSGTAVSITAAQTLYAHWEEAVVPPSTYTVTFDANGGSGEMANQVFVYGEEQALAACTFGPPAPGADLWAFSGWSNLTANAFYAPGAVVSNLTDVAGGVVPLVAVWVDARTDLSKAMHCTSLRWYQTMGTPWNIGGTQGVGGGSCVTNGYSDAVLYAPVETNGTLTFYCRCTAAVSPKLRPESLEVFQGASANGTAASSTNVSVAVNGEWLFVSVPVSRQGTDSWYVNIRLASPPPLPQSVANSGVFMYVDQVSWTPEGASPEPTAVDAREISGVTFSGGVPCLTFTNANERFSYNLRGTNVLTAPLRLWPVLWTTNGTGTITITPSVGSDEPQMFFYLETTAK